MGRIPDEKLTLLMQPDEFKYYLTDSDGNGYSVDDTGAVQASAAKPELPNAPDGWQDTTVSYARNPKYIGYLRSFSVPFKFVLDGAHILRDIVYRGFIETPVNLEIHRLNRDTYKHDLFYSGEIDFTNFADTEDSCRGQHDGGRSDQVPQSE
jgi:hypothetical protein